MLGLSQTSNLLKTAKADGRIVDPYPAENVANLGILFRPIGFGLKVSIIALP